MSKRIWDTRVLDEYELDPLMESSVSYVEDYFQVKLPLSYINLLKDQNGGYLLRNKYPFSHEEEHLDVDYLFGVSSKKSEGVLQTGYYSNEWGLPKGIVLVSGDGERWVGLDYRAVKENPAVIFIDVELEVEERIAVSFDSFIEQLYRDEESTYIENIAFEDDQTEFTYKEGEKVFSGNNVGKISFAVLHFSNTDSDTNWFLNQLNKLASKKNEFIVQDAAEALYTIVDSRYDNNKEIDTELIQQILDKFKIHFDPAIKKYGKKIQKSFDKKSKK